VIGERWGDSARTQGDPGRIQGDSGEMQGGLGDFEWEIPENEFLGQLEEIQETEGTKEIQEASRAI
jgi:hypothetical protein